MSVTTNLKLITKTAARARYAAGQLVAFSDSRTTESGVAHTRTDLHDEDFDYLAANGIRGDRRMYFYAPADDAAALELMSPSSASRPVRRTGSNCPDHQPATSRAR